MTRMPVVALSLLCMPLAAPITDTPRQRGDAAKVATMVTIPDSLLLEVGDTAFASCEPRNASGALLSVVCSWTSSAATVASVVTSKTQRTRVAARQPGTARIVATVAGKRDTVRVRVVTTIPPPDTTPVPPDTTPTPPDTTAPAPVAGVCPASGFLRRVEVKTTAAWVDALAAAIPGDQIRVADGIYNGAVTHRRDGTAANPIVICAANYGKAIVDRAAFRVDGADHWSVLGFSFDGPVSGTPVVYLVDVANGRFAYNEVRDGVTHASLSTDDVRGNLIVEYNHIHHNGVDDELDHGIYWKTTTGAGNVIANNYIHDNKARGISLHDNSGSGVKDVLVTQNTVVGNGAAGILIGTGPNDRIKLVNNVVAFNGHATPRPQIRVDQGDANEIRNNLTYSVTASLAGIQNTTGSPMSGNLVGDPLFVSTADPHLRAGSPAIGLALAGYVRSPDYDGKTRDASPDAGAYEQ